MSTSSFLRGIDRLVRVIPAIVFPSIAGAATLTHNTDGGNWNVPTQWSPDLRIPTTGDTAVINGDRSVTVDTVISQVPDSATVSNNTASGTVNVNAGGALTLGGLSVATSTGLGTVNVTGGTLTVNAAPNISATGTIHVAGGQLRLGGDGTRTVVSGAGELEVSSGSVVANSSVATHVMIFAAPVRVAGGAVSSNARLRFNGALYIEGSAGSITCTDLSNNQSGINSTFNYIFDAAGVGKITCSGFAQLNAGGVTGVTINIDGTAYAGGPAVFDLVDAANIASLPLAINVTGLGTEGVDYQINQSTATEVLQIEILGTTGPGTNVFSAASGDYAAAGNWTLARAPITGDTVVINNNNTANLSSDVSAAVPAMLRVGNQTPATGTLNINSGGKLAATQVQVSAGGAADLLSVNAGGTLETPNAVNLTGAAGTLRVTGTGAVFRNTTDTASTPKVIANGAGTLSVMAGGTVEANNPANLNAVMDFKNATISVNGGTITTDARIRFGFGATTTLNIGGTGSLVAAKDMAPAGAGTVVNYTFDASGVGKIACSGYANLTNMTVHIDASALGGNGGLGLDAAFDLVETNNLVTLPVSVSVTGAAGTEGVDWYVRQDTYYHKFQLVFGDPPLEPIFLTIGEAGGILSITVDPADSKSGFDYTLQSSTYLGGWTPVETKPGTGAAITFTVAAPSSGGKDFYRVTTSPAP